MEEAVLKEPQPQSGKAELRVCMNPKERPVGPETLGFFADDFVSQDLWRQVAKIFR